MSTDIEWERWGSRDPYFGVLTHPRFRAAALTEEARHEFFALGQMHVDHVLSTCHRLLAAEFVPERVLDFGCGVGRLVLPFARVARQVVGVDIAPSMLREAERNAREAALDNVVLVLSDDTLSRVEGRFDLVHTCIVLQHIEIERGLRIFRELLRRVCPGGVGAIHITFGWDIHQLNHGLPPVPPPLSAWASWVGATRALLQSWRGQARSAMPAAGHDADPEMQMNFYNLSQLMFMLQQEGVGEVHTQLTNHGGALGAFMFFRRPGERTGSLLPPLAQPVRVPDGQPTRRAAGETFSLAVLYEGTPEDPVPQDADGAARHPLVISYHWRRADGSLWLWDGLRTRLDTERLRAGDAVHVQIQAPDEPGAYRLEISALREGLHWFEDLGAHPLQLDFDVVAPLQPSLSNT